MRDDHCAVLLSLILVIGDVVVAFGSAYVLPLSRILILVDRSSNRDNWLYDALHFDFVRRHRYLVTFLCADCVVVDGTGDSVVYGAFVVFNLCILLDIVLRFAIRVLVVNVQYVTFSSVYGTPTEIELSCIVIDTSVVLVWVRCRCSYVLLNLEDANIVDEHWCGVVDDVEHSCLAATVELNGVCLPVGGELWQVAGSEEAP